MLFVCQTVLHLKHEQVEIDLLSPLCVRVGLGVRVCWARADRKSIEGMLKRRDSRDQAHSDELNLYDLVRARAGLCVETVVRKSRRRSSS